MIGVVATRVMAVASPVAVAALGKVAEQSIVPVESVTAVAAQNVELQYVMSVYLLSGWPEQRRLS